MNKKQIRLAIIVLGNRNAGKSSTWYELFGRVIRSGWKRLIIEKEETKLFVKNSSFEETGLEISEDIFVRNASFEEAGEEVENYFDKNDLPSIVLCSVQYKEKGLRTIQFFKNHGYSLYIQWLNPGYHDRDDANFEDVLGFEKTLAGRNVEFKIISGKEKRERVRLIKQILVNWIIR